MTGGDARDDEDRAAILARRRRFIALAISGLATTGCKRQAEPCLSVAIPEDPDEQDPGEPGPFVEDPGAPLESDDASEGEGGLEEEPAPRPKPKPRPCLKKRPAPHPCLIVDLD